MAALVVVTRPATVEDQALCFSVKKAALREYVEKIWGWNENFQVSLHASVFDRRKPSIILLDGVPIGTIEVLLNEDHLCLGEFYLLPEFQRRGIGSSLLLQLIAEANGAHLPVRLQYLKVNPVGTLYMRFGFRIVSETPTHFVCEHAP